MTSVSLIFALGAGVLAVSFFTRQDEAPLSSAWVAWFAAAAGAVAIVLWVMAVLVD